MLSKKNFIRVLIGLVVLFVLAELTLFLPAFKPNNPPVTAEVAWNSAEAEAIFRESCADCHSNETVYPWYSYVVPVAWLVNHDVQEGREYFNVSTGQMPDESEEIEEVIMEGEMPPAAYLITHPNAALSDEEIAVLVNGMESSLGVVGESHEREDDEDDDD